MSVKHEHDPEFEEHKQFRNYMRDIILGANDGLVSVFALVIGIAAGGLLRKEILLAGIAAMVAGAISMAIGEYISTKSQEQVYDSEMRLEKEHIADHLDHEKGELVEFYEAKGFSGDILNEIVETISSNPDVLLKEMMMAEFGVLEEERRSPLLATVIVAIAFGFGSLPPVLPFFFDISVSTGILIASVLSIIGLFTIGALKAWFTGISVINSGMENLLLGGTGALITYFIGLWIGSII